MRLLKFFFNFFESCFTHFCECNLSGVLNTVNIQITWTAFSERKIKKKINLASRATWAVMALRFQNAESLIYQKRKIPVVNGRGQGRYYTEFGIGSGIG